MKFRYLAVVLGCFACGVAWVAAAQAPAPDLGVLDVVDLLLENDPNVVLATSRRDVAEGSLLLAEGRFDPRLTTELTGTEAEIPGTGGSPDSQTVDVVLGLDTELRTGLVLSPRISLDREEALGPGALQRSSVAFTLRKPLLRDRNRAVVTAEEQAARTDLSASDLDLQHTISLRIQVAVNQYWRWRAAVEDLGILRASEERSRELLETTRRLIDAGRIPAAELLQLQADLAAKETQRIRGEQNAFTARQALGRELGLSAERIRALPPPSDPFPQVAVGAVSTRVQEGAYVDLALRRRADLAAAALRLESASLRTRAADNGLLPRLDFLLTPGYTTVDTAGFGDLLSFSGESGASASATLSLSWPTLNRQARGRLVQNQALEDQASSLAALLETEIVTRVPTTLDALERSVLELERALEAVRLFEQVAINEEKKLGAGTSTIIDVITQQDRLTGSRLSVVSARLSVAQALVDLRFETGTLLGDWRGGSAVVSYDELTTIPDLQFSDVLDRQEATP